MTEVVLGWMIASFLPESAHFSLLLNHHDSRASLNFVFHSQSLVAELNSSNLRSESEGSNTFPIRERLTNPDEFFLSQRETPLFFESPKIGWITNLTDLWSRTRTHYARVPSHLDLRVYRPLMCISGNLKSLPMVLALIHFIRVSTIPHQSISLLHLTIYFIHVTIIQTLAFILGPINIQPNSLVHYLARKRQL